MELALPRIFGIHQPLAIRPAYYPSPIDLPEKRVGKVTIAHRMVSGSSPIVGMRQALNRGINPVTLKIGPEPLLIHELRHDDHGVWMTDLPEEMFQIAEMLTVVSPSKKVFVGGLGLGIMATLMRDRPGVTDVTVAEIDPDIIEACRVDGVNILQGDVNEILRQVGHHDFFLLDTWQGTSELTWWSEVMPMKRIIRQRFGSGPVVHSWAEDIMIGQVVSTIVNGNVKAWYYKHLPIMNEQEATRFCWNVGTPQWEKKYGSLVDASVAEVSKRKAG
jgi:hypothetical protein